MQLSNAFTAQGIARLLIVSYFIALALGAISGIDIAQLASPFLPEVPALYAMRVLIFTLSGMVLFDIWRRPAALVLALIIFWNSYLTLYADGEIGTFWRDLALIGGLLLTANVTDYADKALSEDWDNDARATYDDTESVGLVTSEEQYPDDFNIVRAS